MKIKSSIRIWGKDEKNFTKEDIQVANNIFCLSERCSALSCENTNINHVISLHTYLNV